MYIVDLFSCIVKIAILLAVIFIVPAVSSKLNLVEDNLKRMPINDFSLSEEGMKMLFCYHDYADCYR